MFIIHLNIIQPALLLFQPHQLLGCDPVFSSASHLPEGDLLVLHFLGSLQRVPQPPGKDAAGRHSDNLAALAQLSTVLMLSILKVQYCDN